MGLVFLIDRPGLHVAAESRVVKRDDAFVVGELAGALDAADEQAAAIVAAAEQAYRDRCDQGYRDGIAQARQELAEQLAAVVAARAVALQSLVPLLADLAMDALDLLLAGVNREAFFARAIAAVQQRLRAVRFARMRVAPAQLADAQAALAALGEATGLGALLTVVADDALAPDACVFESDLGAADASLGKQLDAVRRALNATLSETGSAVLAEDLCPTP